MFLGIKMESDKPAEQEETYVNPLHLVALTYTGSPARGSLKLALTNGMQLTFTNEAAAAMYGKLVDNGTLRAENTVLIEAPRASLIAL